MFLASIIIKHYNFGFLPVMSNGLYNLPSIWTWDQRTFAYIILHLDDFSPQSTLSLSKFSTAGN